MFLYHADKLEDGQEFIVTGDKEQLKPKVRVGLRGDILLGSRSRTALIFVSNLHLTFCSMLGKYYFAKLVQKRRCRSQLRSRSRCRTGANGGAGACVVADGAAMAAYKTIFYKLAHECLSSNTFYIYRMHSVCVQVTNNLCV